MLVKAATPQDPKADESMRKVYDGLQQGKIDRSLFTDNANAYFTDAGAEGLCRAALDRWARRSRSRQSRTSLRGGMTARIYEVKYPKKNLVIIIYQMPDGKIEQYLIAEQ